MMHSGSVSIQPDNCQMISCWFQGKALGMDGRVPKGIRTSVWLFRAWAVWWSGGDTCSHKLE